MDDRAFIDALKAVGHPARLSILHSIADTERNVSQIEEAAGVTQPTLSQQLAILRKSELVRTRREAKQIFYSIRKDRFTDLSDCLSRFIAQEKTEATENSKKTSRGVANFARLA